MGSPIPDAHKPDLPAEQIMMAPLELSMIQV